MSRDCCTLPANCLRLSNAIDRPSGRASASAMTITVSRVAHGLRQARPRLNTTLCTWCWNQTPTRDGAAASLFSFFAIDYSARSCGEMSSTSRPWSRISTRLRMRRNSGRS